MFEEYKDFKSSIFELNKYKHDKCLYKKLVKKLLLIGKTLKYYKIVHNDIWLNNIMLDCNEDPILIDFGKAFFEKDSKNNLNFSTVYQSRSLEKFQRQPNISHKSDL